MTQPSAVSRAIALLLGMVGVGFVATVLTWVLRDDLIRSWAEGNPSVRATLSSGGLEAVKAGSIPPPDFVPVAVVLFVVVASLLGVLTVFLRNGYVWARPCLTGLLVFTAIATVGGVRSNPPVVFVVFAVVSLILEAVALRYLWHQDTSAYISGVEPVEHDRT